MRVLPINTVNYQVKNNRVQASKQNVNFQGDGKALLYGTGALFAVSLISIVVPPVATIAVPLVALAAQQGNKE